MKKFTPNKLKDYIKDYGYEITLEQAQSILELLYDYYYGIYNNTDIQEATDYIVNGNKSKYAKLFGVVS